MLERPNLDTKSWQRELKTTCSPIIRVSMPIPRAIAEHLTCTTDIQEFFAQCILPIAIKVVAHEAAVADQTEASPLLASSKNLMTVVPDFGILKTLLVVLPESLDPASAFVPVPYIVAPRALDAACHIVPVTVAHRLKSEKLH